MKTITNEKEYRTICRQMNVIIDKGTELGDMELLSEADKNEYIRLSEMVRQWESIHYPFPIVVNPSVANAGDSPLVIPPLQNTLKGNFRPA